MTKEEEEKGRMKNVQRQQPEQPEQQQHTTNY